MVLVTSIIFADCVEIVNAGTKTAEDTEDAEQIVIRSPKNLRVLGVPCGFHFLRNFSCLPQPFLP
jgi:hypothetical protein